METCTSYISSRTPDHFTLDRKCLYFELEGSCFNNKKRRRKKRDTHPHGPTCVLWLNGCRVSDIHTRHVLVNNTTDLNGHKNKIKIWIQNKWSLIIKSLAVTCGRPPHIHLDSTRHPSSKTPNRPPINSVFDLSFLF